MTSAPPPAFSLVDLRVENRTKPLGIDLPEPRFSWKISSQERALVQLRYRIRVFLVDQRTGEDSAVVWDSDEIRTAEPFGAGYDGDSLQSASRYRWSVEVETRLGVVSATSSFSTGLFSSQDWEPSLWIGSAARSEPIAAAPLLRTEFDVLERPASAILFVAAGGYANVSLNGSAISDAVLSPGFSDYDDTVQYVATDLTNHLQVGVNALGIELGRGFYGMTNPNVWNWHQATWHAEPVVKAILKITDRHGSVVNLATDGTWRVEDGPTRLDDLYGGENFDARLDRPGFDRAGFDDSGWAKAVPCAGPAGTLQHQRQQPITIAETLSPIAVRQIGLQRWVVAFPRVIAGWAQIRATGSAGTCITIAYGERLHPDGTVDLDNNGKFRHGFQTDNFTLAGTGQAESWQPRFSYKGFQYVQIDGWPTGSVPDQHSLTAKVVHTAAETTGRFECSNEIMNQIHSATVNTLLNNLHGIPTDTPMFEKNGWTGDGMVGAEMFLLNLDSADLFAKWVRDIENTRRENGAPLVIAPASGSWGDWGAAPTWHSAYVLIPWWLYVYAGDRRTLEVHYAGMREYVNFELGRSPGGIANTSLGDWVSPETDPGGGNAPEDPRLSATAFLYLMLDTMGRIASVLGHQADAVEFTAQADTVRTAFIQRFFDTEHGIFRGDGDHGFRQTHNLLALAFGLAPDPVTAQRVADSIAADVVQRGNHLNTGALGTKHLLPVLTAYGHAEAAVAVASQTSFPSWGFWIANGATTMWEHWKIESRSRGHYFLGTIDDWFFHDVAGIRPLTTGYGMIRVAPAVTGQLDWARASVSTPYGRAAIDWRRSAEGLTMNVVIPAGAAATIAIPTPAGGAVHEMGRAIADVERIIVTENTDAGIEVTIGSGSYSFTVGNP